MTQLADARACLLQRQVWVTSAQAAEILSLTPRSLNELSWRRNLEPLTRRMVPPGVPSCGWLYLSSELERVREIKQAVCCPIGTAVRIFGLQRDGKL